MRKAIDALKAKLGSDIKLKIAAGAVLFLVVIYIVTA